jgi:predicted enzyme related to lactoylglutathione lyase
VPKSPRPSHHALILAANLRRADTFYARVFECDVETRADDTCRFMVRTIDEQGAVAAVIRLRTPDDQDRTNWFIVESIDRTTELVYRQQGTVLMRSVAPGRKRFAFCQDTEGNRFLIEELVPRLASEA